MSLRITSKMLVGTGRLSKSLRLCCIDCSAYSRPLNRLVATFVGSRNLAFVIRSSKIQGKGAFATRRIRKGARIIEYLGECIDADESDLRYPDDEMGRHHTFLFSIGDGTRVLDAGPLEWPAKYVNHSCDPNCEAIEEEDGRVFVHALQTLEEGQELLYDYAYERTPEHTEDDEILYKCLCGSPKCRGSILAPPKPVKAKKARKGKDGKEKKSKSEKKQKKEKKEKREKQEKQEKQGKQEKQEEQGKQDSTSSRQRTALDVDATQASSALTRKSASKSASKSAGKSASKSAGKSASKLAGKSASKLAGKTSGTRKVAGGAKRTGRTAAR